MGHAMEFDPDRVTTVTFDSYSTLLDVESTAGALEPYADDPEPIATLWRSRSLEYAMVSNFVDAYDTFYEMNRDALTHALAVHGIDLSGDEIDDVLAVYHELDVFPDVVDGMERLRDAGYDLYVVSNGNPEMLDSLVDHAGIGDLIEDTVSADEVATFKPDAEIYRHAAGRTGTPIDEIAHLAAGWFDVQGAVHAGMQAVWVDRKDTPPEPFGRDPSLVVDDFHEFADELGA